VDIVSFLLAPVDIVSFLLAPVVRVEKKLREKELQQNAVQIP
jgi:hypothetical protein